MDRRTDGQTDGQSDKGDYYGPQWVNSGSKMNLLLILLDFFVAINNHILLSLIISWDLFSSPLLWNLPFFSWMTYYRFTITIYFVASMRFLFFIDNWSTQSVQPPFLIHIFTYKILHVLKGQTLALEIIFII